MVQIFQKPRVREAMTRDLVTVTPETAVWEAEHVAARHTVRHLLVTSDDHLVGVLCVCDLERTERSATVRDCMSCPVFTLHDAAPLEEAVWTMRSCGVGCVPVVKDGHLLGIVTRRDLRRYGLAVERGLWRECASCGSRSGVQIDPRTHAVAFCRDCLDRARPDPDDDLGNGD